MLAVFLLDRLVVDLEQWCPTSWPRSRPSNFLAGLSVSGAEQWIFIAYLAAGLQFAFEFETQPGPHFFQPDQLRLCRGISSLVILAGCTVEIIRRWQADGTASWLCGSQRKNSFGK